MSLIGGSGLGFGYWKRRRCIVGVALYHVTLCLVKCSRKVGVRRAVRIMVPLEWRGARKEARRPWM